MKYALGNMLNGAGGLNADGLSLDLQFATDKALTARKGPTPVFTRASTATFVGSNGLIQSAAINAARFDHDPVSPFACKGLLIEESRTNLIIQSEDFSIAWTTARASISVNQTASPTGATTADKLITDTSVSNNHRVDKVSVSLSLNTVYTFSVYAKAGEYSGLALGVGIAVSQLVDYSLTGAGSVTRTSAGASGTIQRLSDGWYRCTCTFTSDLASGSHRACVFIGQSGTVFTYTGDGTSSISIWGAQLEAGAFPTSYIPTVAASVVRSADVCSITGTDFNTVYNESEHTLFAEASGMSHTGFPSYLSFDNSTAAEQSALAGYPSTNRVGCIESDGGSTFAAVLINVTLGQNNKMAAAMKLNSFQLSLNGALGTEDTSGTMSTATSLKIGRNWQSVVLSGTYKQVKVFKKRLPNAKLQTLTT